MSIIAHYTNLLDKHDKLQSEIHSAYMTHCSDMELSRLKKIKLKLKEEIAAMERQYPMLLAPATEAMAA